MSLGRDEEAWSNRSLVVTLDGCSVFSVRKIIPRSGETDHGQTAWLSAAVEPSPDPESAAVERRIQSAAVEPLIQRWPTSFFCCLLASSDVSLPIRLCSGIE